MGNLDSSVRGQVWRKEGQDRRGMSLHLERSGSLDGLSQDQLHRGPGHGTRCGFSPPPEARLCLNRALFTVECVRLLSTEGLCVGCLSLLEFSVFL